MNKVVTSQPNVFFQANAKQKEIGNWIKNVNQPNKKSIYNLTWIEFHKQLHQLGINEFLKQYGYSYKKNLQLAIAKSTLSQKRIALYDFEKSTAHALLIRLGDSFFDKITCQSNFNPKNHSLSTIHYFIYQHSLNLAAISLGFASKQCFLNFLAQTLYITMRVDNMAQNLRITIESLQTITPCKLREELAQLYDQPLVKNKNFLKYNYTLEELKLALENEKMGLVVASLGANSVFYVNKKLQTLSPILNISLQDLKERTWEALKENTPILFWKIKLYQLFSGQIPLEQGSLVLNIPRSLRHDISVHWQFFSSQHIQVLNEGQQLHMHETEIAVRTSIYQYSY